MNISKADALAHLAKWFDSGARVRATFRTISGNSFIVGTIKELSPAAIKVTGSGWEMMLHSERRPSMTTKIIGNLRVKTARTGRANILRLSM
jgi:hypothetical protein